MLSFYYFNLLNMIDSSKELYIDARESAHPYISFSLFTSPEPFRYLDSVPLFCFADVFTLCCSYWRCWRIGFAAVLAVTTFGFLGLSFVEVVVVVVVITRFFLGGDAFPVSKH